MERKDIILWVILISLRNAYKLIEDLDLECKYYWYGATMYFKAIRKMCTTYDETTSQIARCFVKHLAMGMFFY